MARGRDFIIGRRGDGLRGKVLDKHFEVKSVFGPVRVDTKNITWIHFKNPPQFREDEIWLKNGDRMTGRIQATHVRFKSEAGGELEIPRQAIHTVIVNQKWLASARPLTK